MKKNEYKEGWQNYSSKFTNYDRTKKKKFLKEIILKFNFKWRNLKQFTKDLNNNKTMKIIII